MFASLRRFYVDVFLERCKEESTLDVELANIEFFINGKQEDNQKRSEFPRGGKSVIVVPSRNLQEALNT